MSEAGHARFFLSVGETCPYVLLDISFRFSFSLAMQPAAPSVTYMTLDFSKAVLDSFTHYSTPVGWNEMQQVLLKLQELAFLSRMCEMYYR